MHLNIFLVLTFIGLFSNACPIYAGNQDLYLQGNSKIGVVLCHGGGAYPDWKVVGDLRKSLNSGELKAHTISLQMPTASGKWTNYFATFPDSILKIREGVASLRKNGVDTVILIGHSMGSRMASYFLAVEKDHGVSLFVGLGMRNNGGEGLNVVTNMRKIDIPMLDIYGSGGDGGDLKYGQERRALKIKGNEQIVIKDANHKFDGYGVQLNQKITGWLKTKLHRHNI